MATTPVVTVRLEPELRERLDRLAKAQRRSRSFMATEAIREYVQVNEWQIEETQKALAEADRGEFATPQVRSIGCSRNIAAGNESPVPADCPPRPREIRWLKRASANLEAEADYIARDRPEVAQSVLDTIARAVQLLAQYPGSGRPGRVEGTRELVVPDTPYLVPYRVRGNAVEILRVFHGARKWPKKL